MSKTDSHRIGLPLIAVLGCTALLLVGVGGVVAATQPAEVPVEQTVESHGAAVGDGSAAVQEEGNDTEESASVVNPTPDDEPYKVGETVPIELSLGDSDVVTVTLSANDSDQDARFTATVRANDSSGNATVRFDTDAFAGENDGFSVADENVELVNTSSEYEEGLADAGLGSTTYDITLAAGDRPHYEEGVDVVDRSVLELIDPQVTIEFPASGAVYEGDEQLTMELSYQDTDVGTVSINFVGQSATFTATVSDDDGDGNATISFDPAAVVDGNDGFSAGNGTTLVAASANTDDSVGVPSLYDVSVTTGEDAPGSAGATATDSAELVVSGGDETGGENGAENGTENGTENGNESTADGNGSTDDGNESTDDGDGPGFGVLAVLGAVAAIALLARTRFET
ncbi:hypothetical protein BRD19_07075 [Halobacteriales archaeon SW_7_65_23]|nr:MAG: hypothetical protein BRD19_07075 [Halobacteriales archaeon SW_7_65_23]